MSERRVTGFLTTTLGLVLLLGAVPARASEFVACSSADSALVRIDPVAGRFAVIGHHRARPGYEPVIQAPSNEDAWSLASRVPADAQRDAPSSERLPWHRDYRIVDALRIEDGAAIDLEADEMKRGRLLADLAAGGTRTFETGPGFHLTLVGR